MLTLAPKPALEEGEVAEEEFVGPFSRVTLLRDRLVFSTFLSGDRVIAYGDVKRVVGGFSAGAHDLRDNSSVVYGIYVAYGNSREEWAWIPRPKDAAALIEQRRLGS